VPPYFLQFAIASFVAASSLERGPHPRDYSAVLLLRNRYREISGFACRDHNFWIDPALSANSFESELLNRGPSNIGAVVLVLEMLILRSLPLAAIQGSLTIMPSASSCIGASARASATWRILSRSRWRHTSNNTWARQQLLSSICPRSGCSFPG
jgi:hypothetical protein